MPHTGSRIQVRRSLVRRWAACPLQQTVRSLQVPVGRIGIPDTEDADCWTTNSRPESLCSTAHSMIVRKGRREHPSVTQS
jgi:hypothetical protein